MELVQEDDVPALPLGDLLQDRLHPLLELTPVLGPCEHGGDIQRHQLFVGQGRGDIAGHDALSQTFDDGGLSHAGLSNEDRIVLGPPGQNLHHPSDFFVPADDWIQLPETSRFREVPAVTGESPEGVFRCLVRHPVGAPDPFQSLPKAFPARACGLEDAAGIALLFRKAQEEVFGGHVLVPKRLGLFLRQIEGLGQVPGKGGIGAPRHAGPSVQGFQRSLPDQAGLGPQFLENGHHNAPLLLQKGLEKMDSFDLRMFPPSAFLGRGLNGIRGFDGEPFRIQHERWTSPMPAIMAVFSWFDLRTGARSAGFLSFERYSPG